MFASVIIDVASSNVDYEFEYEIPHELLSQAMPGCRVKVPFGLANREIMGYIVEVYEESRYQKQAKFITDIIDFEPLITEEQFTLAKNIKTDTLSPLIRVLNLMIPQNLRLKTTRYLIVKDLNMLDANLAKAIGGKTKVAYHQVLSPYQSAITKAVSGGHLEIRYEARDRRTVKNIIKYQLQNNFYHDNITFLSPKRYQEAISQLIYEKEPLTRDELIEKYGFTVYMIKRLVKEGFLKEIKETASRIQSRVINYQERLKQKENYHHTKLSVDKVMKDEEGFSNITLWKPATEQEELMFLLLVVDFNLSKNLNTLIVCPDILSSYRIASFLSYELKQEVATLNSDRTNVEILDYYEAIKNNEYPVIVTTTLGAFFPFQNIGTILMLDSESDLYLNDQSPRYDLKQVMKMRAGAWNSKLIFHSLAPSLEIYSEALLKQYHLVNDSKGLHHNISVVDMTQELRGGNRLPLSKDLIVALKSIIVQNKQALLILNNRGYSQSLLCRSCGAVINCPKCEIPLRYHKEPNAITCPTCSHKQSFNNNCPTCGSDKIRHIGLGMEKLVEVINHELSGARPIIVDQSQFKDFELKMDQVMNNEVNIIITSDLFARSIVNRRIALVAIINLDIVAKSPVYDAHHRAFAMLTHAKMHLAQHEGEMIIQTYDPKMPFLASFIKDDYLEYFQDELKLRETLKVSPIYQVNRILVKAPYGEGFKVALNIKKALQHLIKYVIIIGPVYNNKEKAIQLIIKHQNNQINTFYENLYRTFQNEQVIVIFDKYPKAIT